MSRKLKFKGKTLFKKTCVDNIIRVYRDNNYKAEGCWYTEANTLANTLANTYNTDPKKVAGVISALSPLKSWDENKKIAVSFLEKKDAKHTKTMVAKAEAIKNYVGDKLDLFIKETLNGNKIKSFYINISDPSDKEAVTIDRHAIAVLLNRPIKENEGSGITLTQYNFLRDCYIEASEKLGVVPHKVQSVTWVKWREMKKDGLVG